MFPSGIERDIFLNLQVSEASKWAEEILSIQPGSSALNAVIEAATAKQDLPTAATLSAGEQPSKETGDA